jgi:hypothetical protein
MGDPRIDLRDSFLDMFEAELISPIEIAAAFMDAFERYAHHKGHECERSGQALRAGQPQKKRRKPLNLKKTTSYSNCARCSIFPITVRRSQMTPIKLRGSLERFMQVAGDAFERIVYHDGWREPRPVKPPRIKADLRCPNSPTLVAREDAQGVNPTEILPSSGMNGYSHNACAPGCNASIPGPGQNAYWPGRNASQFVTSGIVTSHYIGSHIHTTFSSSR